jgi:hypothetical protein
MPQEQSAAFQLNVLNPGGNDPEQHFAAPESGGKHPHAPVNFHAYAACTGGSFFRDTSRAAAAGVPVLLLLRGDLRAAERALDALLAAGVQVAVSLKETGLHQIAEQLEDKARLERFLCIVRKAHRCLAPTAEAADIYRFARGSGDGVAFIPTPYPLHDPKWDFSKPNDQRAGILVGTREWDVPSRNHAAAVLAARNLSEATDASVTIYNEDGWSGARMLRAFGYAENRLRILKTETPYVEYLGVLSQHRIVLELDTSFVPDRSRAMRCSAACRAWAGMARSTGLAIRPPAGRGVPARS